MSASRVSTRILLMLILSLIPSGAVGQANPQLSEERAIAVGRTDKFNVDLKKGQFASITVMQKGIDVGVAVTNPAGVQIRFVDGADGTSGTENVSVVAESEGQYHFEVQPVDRFRNPPPGRYEIRITEVREATDQELREGRIGFLKTQGLALVNDIEQLLQEVHDPETRARFQMRSANLLWGSDDARGVRLMASAMDSLNEIFAAAGAFTSAELRAATVLRRQVIQSLVSRDPELALTYLRAARVVTDPDNVSDRQLDMSLELTAAARIAMANPQRAFQVAEEVLKEGPSQELIDIVRLLQQSNSPDLAETLARDIMTTLANRRLMGDAGTANLAAGMVQYARTAGRATQAGRLTPLTSSAEFAAFYQKAVTEVLSYTPPEGVTNERSAALNLAQALTNRPDEARSLSPDRATALTRKAAQLAAAPAARVQAPDIESETVERGLSIAQASPPELRESLYYELANKAASEGDLDRARQIINDYLPASSRQSALVGARRQAVSKAASRGNLDDAMRLAQSEPAADARVAMLSQIVGQIGSDVKASTAVSLLDQARSMMDPSPRAAGEEEMTLLLAIGEALAKVSPERAGNILDPLVEQFNDLSQSAMIMNGFPEKYYRNGDLRMSGNNLADLADGFAKALANLALTDVQRAKATADRFRPVTARIEIYLQMATKVTRPSSWFD